MIAGSEGILGPSIAAAVAGVSTMVVAYFAHVKVSKQKEMLLSAQSENQQSEAIRERAEAASLITQSAQDLISEHRKLYEDSKKETEEARARNQELIWEAKETQKVLRELRDELRKATRQLQRLRDVAQEYGVPDSAWMDST